MKLNIESINWLAVAITTILSFTLGAAWHHDLAFGKIWKNEIQQNSTYNKKSHPTKIFGVSAILHFFLMVMLNLIIGPESNWLLGLITGLSVSISIVMTTIGATYLFSGRSLRLWLIDGGFYVLLLSISGVIFATMG